MRQRLSLVIAFVGVLGLLGLSPASATHDGGAAAKPKKDVGKHEGMPTPPDMGDLVGTCAILSSVSIGNSNGTGGIEAHPTRKNHNHYRFTDTVVTCVAPGTDFNGDFDVQATGGTDGPASVIPTLTEHGEDSTLGWSHSDCYASFGVCPTSNGKAGPWQDIYAGTNENPDDGDPQTAGQCTNCGEIWVTSVAAADSTSTLNWVKFIRQASVVTAWGALVVDGGGTPPVVCFLATLNFTPDNEIPPKEKVDHAILSGTAVLWGVDDKEACAGDKGQKH